MELFDTSEVLVLSQTVDEKVTDEYFAAKKIHDITVQLYESLNLPIPDKFVKLNQRLHLSDTFLSTLIYPLDGYKAKKEIHIPPSKGPRWSWPAFIIPELWFMWHEIWGVSLLVVALEFAALRFVEVFKGYFLLFYPVLFFRSGLSSLYLRIGFISIDMVIGLKILKNNTIMALKKPKSHSPALESEFLTA